MTEDQIWMIHGHKPCRWTLPVLAERRGGIIGCRLALALPKIVENAFAEKISEYATERNGLWWLGLPRMSSIGTRLADGTDPETVFSWSRPIGLAQPYASRRQQWDRKEFLDSFCDLTGTDRSAVEWLWSQLLQHSLDWLAKHGRTLDLGFCLLHPWPFRMDAIVAVDYAGSGYNTAKSWWHHILRRKNPDRLVRPRLLRMDARSPTIALDLHVELDGQWKRTAKAAELRKLRRLGASGYWVSTRQRMFAWSKTLLRYCERYDKERRSPRATVFKCVESGLYRLATDIRPAGGRAPLRRFIALGDRVTLTPGQNGDVGTWQASNGCLLKLSDLQLGDADLWKRGSNVRGLVWGSKGPWLLVLPATEDQIKGAVARGKTDPGEKSVLVEVKDRRSEWMG